MEQSVKAGASLLVSTVAGCPTSPSPSVLLFGVDSPVVDCEARFLLSQSHLTALARVLLDSTAVGAGPVVGADATPTSRLC